MGDVDLKFDKFMENYNLDMKILLTKIDSLFYTHLPVKPLEYDNCNVNNSMMTSTSNLLTTPNNSNCKQTNDIYENNGLSFTNTLKNINELEIGNIDNIEKTLLIERMLNDNISLFDDNFKTNSTPVICNNKSSLPVHSNLKSILIKSSSINNSDSNNNCSELHEHSFNSENKSILHDGQNVKLKRNLIKKQLTFGEDMMSLKSKPLTDNSDNLSLNSKMTPPLANKLTNGRSVKKSNDENLHFDIKETEFEDLLLHEYDKTQSNILAESEDSLILMNDGYSTVLLNKENEKEETAGLLKAKCENNFKKNTDL